MTATRGKATERRAGARRRQPAAKARVVPGGSAGDPSQDLKELPLADVARQLEASPDGLTADQAKQRLARYGPNEIAEETTSSLRALLAYFWGPIPWMIEAAVILDPVKHDTPPGLTPPLVKRGARLAHDGGR